MNALRQKYARFFLGSLFLSGSFSWADEPLKWDVAAREASRGNADVRAAEEAVAKAKAQVGVAFSPFLPQVSGTVSYSHGNASTASGSVPGSGGGSTTAGSAFGVITTTNQYSFGLSASQNLFNGFQDRATLVQARANLAAAEAALKAQKSLLHQSLKKAFFQLLYSQKAVQLSKKIEERRKNNYELVELRFGGGRENKGSALKSHGQWRQAQFNTKMNRRNIRIAQQSLGNLLGRREFENILVEGVLETKDLPAQTVDTRDLSKTTPAVQQSAANLKAAEAYSANAFGAMLPNLSVNGSLSKVGLNWPPDTSRWSVGMSLSIPLFQYSNIATLSSAHAAQRQAEFSFQSADRQAAVQLSTTFTGLQLAIENVDVQTEVRDAAQVRAEIARGQYTSGLCSYTDWDLIETDLITQELQLLSNEQAAVNAEADWEQAQGLGDIP